MEDEVAFCLIRLL